MAKLAFDDDEIRDLQDAVSLSQIAFEMADDRERAERYTKLADKLMVGLLQAPPGLSIAAMLGERRRR